METAVHQRENEISSRIKAHRRSLSSINDRLNEIEAVLIKNTNDEFMKIDDHSVFSSKHDVGYSIKTENRDDVVKNLKDAQIDLINELDEVKQELALEQNRLFDLRNQFLDMETQRNEALNTIERLNEEFEKCKKREDQENTILFLISNRLNEVCVQNSDLQAANNKLLERAREAEEKVNGSGWIP